MQSLLAVGASVLLLVLFFVLLLSLSLLLWLCCAALAAAAAAAAAVAGCWLIVALQFPVPQCAQYVQQLENERQGPRPFNTQTELPALTLFQPLLAQVHMNLCLCLWWRRRGRPGPACAITGVSALHLVCQLCIDPTGAGLHRSSGQPRLVRPTAGSRGSRGSRDGSRDSGESASCGSEVATISMLKEPLLSLAKWRNDSPTICHIGFSGRARTHVSNVGS